MCIFGSGAGGVSAGLHTLSKLSRGKFARAIAMSGNALVPAAVGEERQADDVEVMELARLFACSVTPLASLVECLRHAEAMPLARHAASMSPWLPVVDKPALFTANGTTPFLDKKLKDLIAEEYTNNVRKNFPFKEPRSILFDLIIELNCRGYRRVYPTGIPRRLYPIKKYSYNHRILTGFSPRHRKCIRNCAVFQYYSVVKYFKFKNRIHAFVQSSGLGL